MSAVETTARGGRVRAFSRIPVSGVTVGGFLAAAAALWGREHLYAGLFAGFALAAEMAFQGDRLGRPGLLRWGRRLLVGVGIPMLVFGAWNVVRAVLSW